MAKEGKTTVVPRLRFPEFREAEGWDVLPMGSLMSLEYGASLPEHSRRPGSVPVMGSNGVVGYHDEALVKGPAIVIGRKGSVGEINWIDKDCCPIDTTYYVENKQPSSASMQFLYRLLQRSKLDQRGDPGAVPGLNRNAVHSLQTAIPKPPEQQKIADCLTSLDEVIAAQGRKVAALKTYKRGLMQQLFPREGETLPRLRFPEFRDAPEWEAKQLGAVCEMQAGKFVAASEIAEEQETGTYPCFGGNGLRGFTKTYTHSGRHSLIGRQGALCGNVNLVGGCFHATEHAVVTTPKVGISVDWLFYALSYLNLNRFATGQAQPGLSVEVLEKVELAAPHSEREQQVVAACLASLDTRVALEFSKLEALKTHKKSLMQQLFPSPEEA